LVELAEGATSNELRQMMSDAADVSDIGLTTHLHKLTITTTRERAMEISLDELTAAWRGTLDW